MAAIYLRHPVHGQKVATSDLEANYDKGHGWSEFDPFVKPPVVEEVPVVPLPPIFAPPPPVVDGQDIINQMLTKPPKRTRTPKTID